MSNETVNLKEFIAIMVAAVMIITPLVLTNQPPSRGTMFVGQASGIQMSSNPQPMDFTHDSIQGADAFNTERVAPPGSDRQWNCGFGSWFGRMIHWIGGGMFHHYLN